MGIPTKKTEKFKTHSIVALVIIVKNADVNAAKVIFLRGKQKLAGVTEQSKCSNAHPYGHITLC